MNRELKKYLVSVGGFFQVKKHQKPCTSSMVLWVSLQEMSVAPYGRRLNKYELIEVIRNYPDNTNSCKCRNCRYYRMYHLTK